MEKEHLIKESTVICRNEKRFLVNKLGDELVMLNLETGEFIAMNTVGSDIWILTENPVSVKELLVQLKGMYDISDEICERETFEFLNKSVSQQLFVAL